MTAVAEGCCRLILADMSSLTCVALWLKAVEQRDRSSGSHGNQLWTLSLLTLHFNQLNNDWKTWKEWGGVILSIISSQYLIHGSVFSIFHIFLDCVYPAINYPATYRKEYFKSSSGKPKNDVNLELYSQSQCNFTFESILPVVKLRKRKVASLLALSVLSYLGYTQFCLYL